MSKLDKPNNEEWDFTISKEKLIEIEILKGLASVGGRIIE